MDEKVVLEALQQIIDESDLTLLDLKLFEDS